MTPADHEAVLAINEQFVHLLAPMDQARLEMILGLADRALVVEDAGAFAGFVITIPSGTEYDSVNYRWFAERYDDFYYLDRIVLAPNVRRSGLGSQIYDVLEARGRELAPRMCLEVNADPPNVPSLNFHSKRGFREVGQLGEPGHLDSLRMLEF